MPLIHAIERPQVEQFAEWSGDNLAELQGLFPNISIVDNGNGTLLVDDNLNQYVAEQGDWLTPGGPVMKPADQARLQVVSEPGPLDYGVSPAP